MIRQPAISRADLVRCFGRDPKHLDECADALGFERITVGEVIKPEEIGAKLDLSIQATSASEKKVETKAYQASFWQHVKTTAHFVDSEKNISSNQRVPKSIDELLDTLDLPKPENPARSIPLIRWNKMWPFARAALSTSVPSGQVDVDSMVRSLSKGRMVTKVPRKPRQTWAATAQVVVDRDRRLVPYWTDQLRFIQRLKRWRGKLGLNIAYVERRAGRTLYHSNGLPYSPPPPDVPILLLSDLGCLDFGRGEAGNWLRLGRELRAAGHKPVVLAPCPRDRWQSPLDKVYRMACWDYGQRLPSLKGKDSPGLGRLSAAEDGKREAGLEKLLGCLSMLVNVEPELLRALRLLLINEACDVSAEYDAWQHRHVHGPCITVMGLKRDEGIRNRYRKKFEYGLPLSIQQEVVDLAIAHHQGKDKREFLLEELCHFTSLPAAKSKYKKEAVKFFKSTTRFLESEQNWKDKASEVVCAAAWVTRVITRLSPEVREWPDISNCWQVAIEKLTTTVPGTITYTDIPKGIQAWRPPPVEVNVFTGNWWHIWQRGCEFSLVPAKVGSVPPGGTLGAPLAMIRNQGARFELITYSANEESGSALKRSKFF